MATSEPDTDAVLRDISSLTASARTLSTLKELLGLVEASCTIEGASKGASRPVKASNPKAPARVRPAPKSSRAAKEITIHDDNSPALPIRDRQPFATKTINAAVKILSGVAKESGTPSREHDTALGAQTDPQAGGQPLTARSPNSPSKCADVGKLVGPRTKTNGHDKPSTISIVAQCAQVALNYVRVNGKRPSAGSLDLVLETGTLSFIAKCLTIGLHAIVLKELKAMKTRIDGISQSLCDTSKTMARTDADQPLHDLLKFNSLEALDGATRVIVTKYEQYVTRLILARHNATDHEFVLQHLDVKSKATPLNMVLLQANCTNNDSDVRRQIEAILSGLLGACPSVALSADQIACDKSKSISPSVAFRLYGIVWHYRVMATAGTGRTLDVEKDYWRPLTKCFAAFARRSSLPAHAKYAMAKQAYERLSETSRKTSIFVNKNAKVGSEAQIWLQLSSLAQKATHYEKAITWTTKYQSSLGNDVSESASGAIVSLRLASLSLQATDEEPTRQHMSAAQSCMMVFLRGDITELDALLLEVASYRKVLMTKILSAADNKCPPSLLKLCYSGIFGCARFLFRYVGKAAGAEADEQILARQCDRREKAKQVAPGLTDCVISCCKSIIQSGDIDWQELDTALDDCLQLVSILGMKEDAKYCESKVVLKTSSLYVALYRHENNSARPISEQGIQALKRSISVLGAADAQIREAGQYVQKLEQLTSHYQAAQDFDHAYACIDKVLKHFFDLGYLQDLSRLSGECSFDAIWTSENGQVVSRVLDDRITLLNFASRAKRQNLSLHDGQYAIELRGLFLEYQLLQFGKSLSKPGHLRSQGQLDCVSQALTTLYELYDKTAFPIRRQRVIAMNLHFTALLSLSLREKFAHVIGEEMLENSDISTSKDCRLADYQQHWYYTNIMCRALLSGSIHHSSLQEALGFWIRSIESRTTSTSSHRVDRVGCLIAMLTSYSTLCEVHHQDHTRLKLLSLIQTLLAKQLPTNHNTSTDALCNLALQHLQTGNLSAARSTLLKAETCLKQYPLEDKTELRYRLVQAQHHFITGDHTQFEKSLSLAAKLAGASIEAARSSTCTKGFLIDVNLWLVRVLELTAEYKTQQGRASEALKDVKHCLKLLQRTWASLENEQLRIEEPSDASVLAESEFSAPGTPICAVSKQMTHEALKGAKFWNLIPVLLRNYQRISSLYRHHGMFAEALYYIDSAQKICDAVPVEQSQILNHSLLAELYFEDEQYEPGQQLLDKARRIRPAIRPSTELIKHHQSEARIFRMQEDFEKELEAWDAGLKVLHDLSSRPHFASQHAADALAEELAKMQVKHDIATSMTATKPKTRSKAATSSKAPARQRQPPRKTEPRHFAPSESDVNFDLRSHRELRQNISMNQCLALLHTHNARDATKLLDSLSAIDACDTNGIRKAIVSAKLSIAEVLRLVAVDCSFAMLPESTISIPSLVQHQTLRAGAQGKAGDVAKTSSRTINSTSVRKVTKTKSAKHQSSTSELGLMLLEMLASLGSVQLFGAPRASVAEYGQLSSLRTTVSALASAVTSTSEHSLSNAYSVAMDIDQSNSYARHMTSAAALAGDRNLSKDDTYTWPSLSIADEALAKWSDDPSSKQFQEQYIDILPESWTAVSLRLSETKEDLFIARYRRDESPFVLRLPIKPHNDDDVDCAFGYKEGKVELRNIIEESYKSTHNSKYVETKEAKQKWWESREILDARIHELLLNIEKIWFGGFRGILCPQPKEPLLLAQFATAIQATFDRYLPSRQGKKQRSAINLDSRIWELFIALGDSNDESTDIDESLVDLLYFVVDILQFNGEVNAYDEIDFDALVIDTLDALNAYHGASRNSKQDIDRKEHMILILDKDLHMFPWESLPCIDGRNVSRLPSLDDLRARILAMKCGATTNTGHHVSCLSGASLLNPGGDLAGTETVMEPLLATLSGDWNHSKTAPTVQDFSNTLTSSSLFLYFGHGSGNQFITTKTVRGLASCPTTWLMGCSSAALRCHGDIFQPSGMVLSYLAAGAPAVVGTLWDVTDKDCDRASVRMGESWGLWQTQGQHKLLALKGRQKVADTEQARGARSFSGKVAKNGEQSRRQDVRGVAVGTGGGKKSLVEAVRLGRAECYLRYLNGAALVVYGIPVYLDD